jgi:cytochrome c oxidase assembly protein subunit 15
VSSETETNWIRNLAVITVCVALLPIFAGALTTTRNAGMAFADWPGSDGYNMLAYPFWRATGDKLLEHSHRLAGVLIGIACIVLTVVAWKQESRSWVRYFALALLLGVIGQGILGGMRVLLVERGLAFVHGSVAALVFGLMGAFAVATSRGWKSAAQSPPNRSLNGLRIGSVVTVVAVYIQFVLGGLVRHKGMLLYEHLGWAFVAAACVLGLSLACLSSGQNWLRIPAATISFLALGQILLGAGTWITKYGIGDSVVEYQSAIQVWTRTAHVLVGMFLFLTTVVLAVRIARLHWCRQPLPATAPVSDISRGLSVPGGAA